MVLRLVAEEVTQYSEDLESEAKRRLLASLQGGLAVVLPFMESALETHFGAAVAAAQQGNSALATVHAAALTATLGERYEGLGGQGWEGQTCWSLV